MESDPEVSRMLLTTVASHLTGAAELLRHAKLDDVGDATKALDQTTEDELRH